MTKIFKIAELPGACPSCGADSVAFEIIHGAFQPIVAVCMGHCGISWTIKRKTLAYGEYFKVAQDNAEG